jgi:hypothetical protein
MRMRDRTTRVIVRCAHRISTAHMPLLIPCAMNTPHTHGWHFCYSTLQRTAVLYAGLKLYFDYEVSHQHARTCALHLILSSPLCATVSTSI